MRYLIYAACLSAVAGLASCESSTGSPDDMVTGATSDLTSSTIDMGLALDLSAEADLSADVDLGAMPLVACLDRPEELPRPPSGTLPCDLIPPGLSL